MFTARGAGAHIGVAIGDQILDLHACVAHGLLGGGGVEAATVAALQDATLNRFMGVGRAQWKAARAAITALLAADCATLRDHAEHRAACVVPQAEAAMLMPANIGDYSDFYSSRQHAFNVGVMFRGAANALQPNWLHLPVGYHGRSSSIVVSGTDIVRPCGQVSADEKTPSWAACALLDFELELAVFTGPATAMGQRVPIDRCDDHLFGVCIMNDWSARDIQKWEYVPLGPFNAKNFATTISPWVVTFEALEPFQVPLPKQDPEVLPYLAGANLRNFDIALEVAIQSAPDSTTVVSRSNGSHLYWTFAQQLAHHTSTGCPMRPGDLLGSGTISGPEEGSYGSMLEITWRGTKPVTLADGTERKFIRDGDAVIMRGHCQGDGFRVGFGQCAGRVLPAIKD